MAVENWQDIKPGMILMGDWSVITPEEYEQRDTALTPARRELRDLLVGYYAGVAASLREAHEGWEANQP